MRLTRFLEVRLLLVAMLCLAGLATTVQAVRSTPALLTSPDASSLAMLDRVTGSMEAATTMERVLRRQGADTVIQLVSSDGSEPDMLLKYLVTYVAWPRRVQVVRCADAAGPIQGNRLLVFVNRNGADADGSALPATRVSESINLIAVDRNSGVSVRCRS